MFDAIRNLQDSAVSMGEQPIVNAHEYWVGGYSYIYMSRNRVLDWNQPSKDFYNSIGAEEKNWDIFHFTGQALDDFVNEEK